MDELKERHPWPARALLLLVLGGLCGLAFHLLIRGSTPWSWTDNPLRLGAAAFVATAGLSFALSLERQRPLWSVAFGLSVGLVVGGVTWRNGSWSLWGSNEGWQLFSAVLAVTIAVPLFQTTRDGGRLRLDYPALHAHSWTDGILLAAALAFMGASFLLAELMAQLFLLIGLHWLEDVLRKAWVDFAYAGAALGTAIGVLRDRDQVLGLLQRVATAIIAVLTPLLALGLVLFVLALPFTGLAPLWEKTKDTTPILLFCVLGAFVLINATIGSSADEEARSPVLRYAALALGAVMLPLGIVAAVSMGKRVGQYGLTPDRLWAIIVVAIALACALGYAFAILRRRLRWAQDVRRANIAVALGVCAVALFLALPIISFGAISAHDQLSRIRSGRVAPDKVDWAAFRFDFGPAGIAALRQLEHSRAPGLSSLARNALAMQHRYEDVAPAAPRPTPVLKTIPPGIGVPPPLRDAVMPSSPLTHAVCSAAGDCLLYWKPGETTAIVLMDHCAQQATGPEAGTRPRVGCAIEPHVLQLGKDGWRDVYGGRAAQLGVGPSQAEEQALLQGQRAAIGQGDVAIREVKRRQLFVGGKPVGDPFE